MTRSSRFTVLVTGGGGRLGRLVVAALRARGTRTLALSRRASGGHTDDLVADLTDLDAVMSVLSGRPVDAIIHLAAAIHHDDAVEIGARMDASLDAIIRAYTPRSVVFTSTGAVYGDRVAQAVSEESATPGDSTYALSKLATEQMLRSKAADAPGLSATTLRIFNVAGPDFPSSLVQRLLAADVENPVRLVCPSLFVRDYIHQVDVVRVILAAMTRPEGGYQAINVGAGVPVSTDRLLNSLRVTDNVWVQVVGTESSNWSDNSLMRRSFGFVPHAVPTRGWALADPDSSPEQPDRV